MTKSVDYERFKANFDNFHLEVAKVEKIYFTKYILMCIDDGDQLHREYLEKTTADLKMLYKSVKSHFKNFPITDKHDENIVKIVSFTKDEWKHGHDLLLEFLFAFLFKTRNYNKLTRPEEALNLARRQSFTGSRASNPKSDIEGSGDQSPGVQHLTMSQSDSVSDLISPELSASTIQKSKLSAQPISQKSFMNETQSGINLSVPHEQSIMRSTKLIAHSSQNIRNLPKIKQIFKNIFLFQKDEFSTNYSRLLLNERNLLSLSIHRSRTDVFQVKFRVAGDKTLAERFVHFENKLMFFYEKERDFLVDKDQYLELFVLVRVDKIKYRDLPNDETKVILSNSGNMTDYEIVISKRDTMTFLFALCIEVIKKESEVIKAETLPLPVNNLGEFMLKIEMDSDSLKTVVDNDEKSIQLKLSYLSIKIRNLDKPKTLYLPILNVFDIALLKCGRSTRVAEVQKILELDYNRFVPVLTISCYNISVCRLSNYFHAYLSPMLENYHESLPFETNFMKSYNELQRATFRIKRYLGLVDKALDSYDEFMYFKYPLFTHCVLIAAFVVTFFFGVLTLIVVCLFVALFYYHPSIHSWLERLFNKIFFESHHLNKYYVLSRFKSEKAIKDEFYFNLDNIDSSLEDTQKLTDKLKAAANISSKIPYYLHTLVDIVDKFKNLIQWKSKRKTELFVFFTILGLIAVYLLGKDPTFIIFLTSEFAYGYRYYKRLLRWNEKVITFIIRYFVIDVLGYSECSCCHEFFNAYANDELVVVNFAKKFSEFLEKHLEIKTPEHLWRENFKFDKIFELLRFSDRRIIVPFYEEKRKPTTPYLMTYFLFTTPSDYYYHNLRKLTEPATHKN